MPIQIIYVPLPSRRKSSLISIAPWRPEIKLFSLNGRKGRSQKKQWQKRNVRYAENPCQKWVAGWRKELTDT